MIVHISSDPTFHVYTLYIMFWSTILVVVDYIINCGFRWCKLIHEWIKKKSTKTRMMKKLIS